MWPASGTTACSADRWRRSDRRPCGRPAAELGVVAAGDAAASGIDSSAEAVPQRLLGAGAGEAQARRPARPRCSCSALGSSAAAGARPANSGRASHSSTNASTPIASIRSASASSAARRAARSSASSMPAVAPISTRPSHQVGVGRGRGAGAAGRPSSSRGRWPARRPSAEQLGGRRARSAVDVGRAAVAGEVDRDHLVVARPGRSASGPQQRPVWVKPWTSTTGRRCPCARPTTSASRRRAVGATAAQRLPLRPP